MAHVFVRLQRALPVLAVLLLLSGGAFADDRFIARGDGWTTYVNARFGVRIDYPGDIFVAEAPPANGDGQSFTAEDATLEVSAFHNADNETPATLRQRMRATEGYEDVTYSPSGRTWLVVSGFRGGRIFYEKYAFNDGVISAFGIDFPKEKKPFYAPIIERMEDSFEPGHAD